MAVISRLWLFLVTLACGALLLTSCSPEPGRLTRSSEVVLFDDAPRRAGNQTILVFSPPSAHTREVWQSLRDELSATFDVTTRPVTPDTTALDLAREINSVRPQALVLMGNLPMNLYLQYQRTNPGPFPPAVVVMATFFEEQRGLFKNTTGISYEIPGITTFVALRSFVYHPVRRVGVLYRPLFTNYIRKQTQLARVEKVDIVAVELSSDPGPYEIRRALRKLTRDDQVDAIWVLNDNVLLEPELVAKGWLKVLHKYPVAVVVGVASLVDTRLHFGSFAMLPDHGALGLQAANMVFQLADENWNASARPVELPLSVQSTVDLPWTRQHFQFREEALERIDRIVQ